MRDTRGMSPWGHVVVLGASGMVGRAIVQEFRAAGAAVSPLTRATADITHTSKLLHHIQAGDLVINCAAYTDVDQAESDELTAFEVNGYAVGRLASACRERSAFLVHFSTDYVFDGQACAPYPVDAPRGPINAYGRSKALGEELLEASSCAHLLIRTSWVYAPWGKNFVLTMVRLLHERDVVRVVNDQRGRPTSALWLAQATRELVEGGAMGTIHVTDDGDCSWHELAVCVANMTGSTCRVRPCTATELPRPASRPHYTVLDLTRTRSAVSRIPGYEENLGRLAPLFGV